MLRQISPVLPWTDEEGQTTPSQDVMFSRAADYYAYARENRGIRFGENRVGITTELDEFRLRCAAGQHDRAARLLIDIDEKGLLVPGRYGEMAELHEQLLGRLTDSRLRMHSLVRLGIAYYRIGKYARAVSVLQMALELAKGEDPEHQIRIKGNIGNCYAAMGRSLSAIRVYSEALETAAELGDKVLQGAYLQCLGNRYAERGDIGAAVSHYDRALEIYRERPNEQSAPGVLESPVDAEIREDHAMLLLNLASLHIDERKFKDALKIGAQAQQAGEAIGSAIIQTNAHCCLATANLCLGNLFIAKGEAEKARKFDVQQFNREAFVLLGLIALGPRHCEVAQRTFERSLQYGEALLALDELNFKAWDFISLAHHGLTRCGLPNRTQATEAYAAARKINNDSGVVNRFKLLVELLYPDSFEPGAVL